MGSRSLPKPASHPRPRRLPLACGAFLWANPFAEDRTFGNRSCVALDLRSRRGSTSPIRGVVGRRSRRGSTSSIRGVVGRCSRRGSTSSIRGVVGRCSRRGSTSSIRGVVGRCSRRGSTSSIRGVVPRASMPSPCAGVQAGVAGTAGGRSEGMDPVSNFARVGLDACPWRQLAAIARDENSPSTSSPLRGVLRPDQRSRSRQDMCRTWLALACLVGAKVARPGSEQKRWSSKK
jgi:hypothetical protein